MVGPGKGREKKGEGRPPGLTGTSQAHLYPQGMDLIELLPEAVRVTGCKDRAKPWGGRREVKVSEERDPLSLPRTTSPVKRPAVLQGQTSMEIIFPYIYMCRAGQGLVTLRGSGPHFLNRMAASPVVLSGPFLGMCVSMKKTWASVSSPEKLEK